MTPGEVDLHVGNGSRVVPLVVGTYSFTLPSGLVLDLHNCYFIPSLTRNIISISCLDKNGFSFLFKDNGCSFYKNELFYGKAIVCNGLYVLDIDTPVNNINIKRLKSCDLNSTYLWHYRLGHCIKMDILAHLIMNKWCLRIVFTWQDD